MFWRKILPRFQCRNELRWESGRKCERKNHGYTSGKPELGIASTSIGNTHLYVPSYHGYIRTGLYTRSRYTRHVLTHA
jgi:hypothetical protein